MNDLSLFSGIGGRVFTFYDAFHGIGGFRYGLERAGMVCVGGCEIDKYACRAYGVIYGERCEPTDIRDVDPRGIPDFDALIFGWPCQDNSLAGKRRGQKVGTRSGLLFEAAKMLRIKKPKYFIAENVEGLFSVNGGHDFYQTIRLFSDLGYDCQWQLLNSRWFLPHDRPRIMFVGHLRSESRPKVFPITEHDGVSGGTRSEERAVSPCLRAKQGGADIEEIYIIEPFKGIRRTTPLERFRLQGYPEEWHQKCREIGISDTQLYKLAGNGVSSPVAEEIGRRLLKSIDPTEPPSEAAAV